MTSDSRTPAERAREMRERAETSMSYSTGVKPPSDDAPRAEPSPYERIFTGDETAIPKPEPLKVDTPRVILAGVCLWAMALVVVLVVPALHSDGRSWWVWTCVAGVVLGLMGWAYVRRGRGNAEAA